MVIIRDLLFTQEESLANSVEGANVALLDVNVEEYKRLTPI